LGVFVRICDGWLALLLFYFNRLQILNGAVPSGFGLAGMVFRGVAAQLPPVCASLQGFALCIKSNHD